MSDNKTTKNNCARMKHSIINIIIMQLKHAKCAILNIKEMLKNNIFGNVIKILLKLKPNTINTVLLAKANEIVNN